MDKDIYHRMPSTEKEFVYLRLFQDVWEWELPYKLKCFCWLAVHDRVLIQKNLQLRGFIGPGIYHMCMRGPKDIDHLLIYYPYAVAAWVGVLDALNIAPSRQHHSLESCLYYWYNSQQQHHSLPFDILWSIWRSRNDLIFQRKVAVVREDVIKTVAYFSKVGLTKRRTNRRQSRFKYIWNDFPVGFFDGACSHRKWVYDSFIVLEPSNYYHFSWEGRYGTNSRAEIIALWGVLIFAK